MKNRKMIRIATRKVDLTFYPKDYTSDCFGYTKRYPFPLIEKAKVLLNQTNFTTAEIAYRLGFEHPQSFNKLFKQRTSVSPVQFRRDQLN